MGSDADAAADQDASSAEHEALLSFLYQAPVGLVQCGVDGHIAMLNPLAAQLLLPLTQDPGLANLYHVLADLVPDLRQRVAAFSPRHGRVCNALRLAVRLAGSGVGRGLQAAQRPAWLSLTLLKLDAERLMAVVDDVTEQVQREALLHGGREWLGVVLGGGSRDWAQVRLDDTGRVLDWNDGIGRLTGLEAAAAVGRPFRVLNCGACRDGDGDGDSDSAGASHGRHLADADRDGWCLYEGSHQRADGSRYWGTVLIAPALAGTAEPDTAYHLILRDSKDGQREAAKHLLHTLQTDQLTGVANRQAFFAAAAQAVDHCRRATRPVSLLLIQTTGPADDGALCQLAQQLQAAHRGSGSGSDNGDLLARIGNTRFALLLPGADDAAAAAVAERVHTAVARLAAATAVHVGLAHSAGSDDLDALLLGAEGALQAAEAAEAAEADQAAQAAAAAAACAAVGMRTPSGQPA